MAPTVSTPDALSGFRSQAERRNIRGICQASAPLIGPARATLGVAASPVAAVAEQVHAQHAQHKGDPDPVARKPFHYVLLRVRVIARS